MLAFGGIDAFWYTVAGAAVAFGGILVYSSRRLANWAVRRLKVSWLEWFSEAVDQHVEPKFEQLRAETQIMANNVTAVSETRAAEVKEALRIHTSEEGEIVRAIVKEELRGHATLEEETTRRLIAEEIAPLSTMVTETREELGEHREHDDKVVEAAADALSQGQGALIERMDAQHAELLARIEST